MPLLSTRSAYGLLAKMAHWLVAVAVLITVPLGFVTVQINDSAVAAGDMDTLKQTTRLLALHQSLGVTILVAVLARLLLRLVNPTPPPPLRPRWLRAASALSHAGLYALLILVALSGWLLTSAQSFSLTVWGVVELPRMPVPETGPGIDALAALHLGGAIVLVFVVVVHVVAVIQHHRIGHAPLLNRMLLGHRGRPEGSAQGGDGPRAH